MLKKTFVAAIAAFAATAAVGADLVLVAGGTGRTGWETVKEAMAKGYEVRASTTNVDRARERYGEDGFTWVKMDARVLDQIRVATQGVDYVISTIGTSCFDNDGPSSAQHVDYQGVVNMAGVARVMGVKQFVLTTALNVGVPDQPLNVFCGNVQMWKWLGEDYLRDGDLPYTIIRPGGLGTDAGGQVGIAMAGQGGLETSFIQRADVARVLVEVLGRDDALGKTIEIGGDADAGIDDWRNGFADIPVDPPQGPTGPPGAGEEG